MRKLAAILAADVAGYSRLMQEDDQATLQALAGCRKLFAEIAAARGGRIVNAPGDSILAEFASVVDALESALEIQARVARLNAAVPEARRMQFRIGVNVGDVLVDEAGAIYGDGVNIAARLEGLAAPGGICVSKAVRDQAQGRLRLGFEDLGEKPLKNIAQPVHVYRVAGAGDTAAAPAAAKPNSIAVLAFLNMSGDPEQEHFCDGISEDIITDLSRTTSIAVIGRHSSFAYKGRPTDLRTIGRELGVRYVLEGSVRKVGNRARITAQLIEAETGTHLWANRYDRSLDDVFLVGDEITEEIVTSLDVKLSHGEEVRIWRKALKSPQARDAFNAGMNANYRGTPQDVRQARELFLEAARLEPQSPWAHAQAALTHCMEVIHGWSADPAASLAEARRLGSRARELDETIPGGHAALGLVALFEERHDDALAGLERAHELRPMCSGPKAILGYAQLYSGLWESAVRNAEGAVELNPMFPFWYRYLMGAAWHFGGRHEQALAALRAVSQANPKLIPARLALISAESALERPEQAAAAASAVLKDRPDFSVGRFARTQPFRDKALRERYLESLRAAGLPD
jgi:adenylate cyclase